MSGLQNSTVAETTTASPVLEEESYPIWHLLFWISPLFKGLSYHRYTDQFEFYHESSGSLDSECI